MVCLRENAGNAIMDMLRQYAIKFDVMRTTQRRGIHLDDVSDDEGAPRTPNPNPEPEMEPDEERLLIVLSRAHSKFFVDVTIVVSQCTPHFS